MKDEWEKARRKALKQEYKEQEAAKARVHRELGKGVSHSRDDLKAAGHSDSDIHAGAFRNSVQAGMRLSLFAS
jgi:hypothetical protein